MELGTLLKKLREQRGLTLRQVEGKTGLSNSFLSQAERGLRAPSTDALLKLATVYEVPVSRLIEARNSGRPDQGRSSIPAELDYHTLFRQLMQEQLGPAWTSEWDQVPLSQKMVHVKNAITQGTLIVSTEPSVKLVIRHSFDRFPARTIDIAEAELGRG